MFLREEEKDMKIVWWIYFLKFHQTFMTHNQSNHHDSLTMSSQY